MSYILPQLICETRYKLYTFIITETNIRTFCRLFNQFLTEITVHYLVPIIFFGGDSYHYIQIITNVHLCYPCIYVKYKNANTIINNVKQSL